jgi:tetratricopeptide (TPR) repeat protein
VAAICRRLDGIPLAIELAAARARILTPEQIAARLDERFRLLTGGSSDAPSRQQTLAAALDWSYNLLTAPERRLLERLSVFAGGCAIEAAAAVCVGDDVTADTLFDLLSSLVEKSLLTVEYRGAAARYRLLETIRQYAADHLIAAGESNVRRSRHRDWYLALAQRVAPELRTSQQQSALDSLDVEHDNLRAALAWCRTDPDSGEAGLRLAAALRLFWFMHGYPGEGRIWLAGALTAGTRAPAHLRAQALDGAAALAHSQGDYAAARTLEEQAVELWREAADQRGMAGALSTLGIILKSEGAIDPARAVLEESLALMRAVQDQAGIAVVLNNLAALAVDRGDWASVTTFGEESLAMKRRVGDRSGTAVTLHNLAEAARYRGAYEQAISLLQESLSLFRDLGNTHATAQSLHSLGIVMHHHGDSVRAHALLTESLSLFRSIDERWGIALGLEGIAMVAASWWDWHRATRLLGAAEALRDAIGAPLPPVDRPDYDRTVAAIRTALTEPTFTAAWHAGRAAPLDEAMALAVHHLSTG